jgi:hypothetical protein
MAGIALHEAIDLDVSLLSVKDVDQRDFDIRAQIFAITPRPTASRTTLSLPEERLKQVADSAGLTVERILGYLVR